MAGHHTCERNERLFLCENARPTNRPLPYRSDPDDDLKYFKWKRRQGIFMRGQNFNLSSLFRVAIPTNLLTVERERPLNGELSIRNSADSPGKQRNFGEGRTLIGA